VSAGGAEPEPPTAPSDEQLHAASAEVREVARAQRAGETDRAEELDELSPERQLSLQDTAQNLALKRAYARNLFSLMVVQVIIADGVFVAYAWAGQHWDVPTAAMHAWLAATVVQIVGIVYVVTKHLFPNRDAR
jgi:capsid protein